MSRRPVGIFKFAKPEIVDFNIGEVRFDFRGVPAGQERAIRLLGRRVREQIGAIVPPRQIADFISEVLVLGATLRNDEIALLQPDREVPLGERIF